MNYVRIIPCLDIFKGRVVKGVNFKNIRDAGDPVEIAAAYSQSGADELVFLDISASNEDRGILLDLVKETAKQVTIPFTVGGGIKSLEDMEAVFNAVRRPELISEAAKRFGSERIIVAIDAKRNLDGSYEVYIGGGNIKTGRDAIEWSKEAEQRGAGEILLTSMDTDGTKDGYDLSLLKTATQAVQIPVTASGGAGRLEHFAQAVTKGGARGLLAASLFHYGELTVIDVKNYLKEKGIRVRLETCL
jgi:cyclase